jgi:hypothetical protein
MTTMTVRAGRRHPVVPDRILPVRLPGTQARIALATALAPVNANVETIITPCLSDEAPAEEVVVAAAPSNA